MLASHLGTGGARVNAPTNLSSPSSPGSCWLAVDGAARFLVETVLEADLVHFGRQARTWLCWPPLLGSGRGVGLARLELRPGAGAGPPVPYLGTILDSADQRSFDASVDADRTQLQ